MAEDKKLKRKKDERRYQRFAPGCPIRIMLIDESGIPGIIGVHDVSEEGLQFSCKSFVKRSIFLRILIERAGQEPLALAGRVVWVDLGRAINLAHRVGVAFVNLTEAERTALKIVVPKIAKKRWWFGKK